MDCSKFLLPVMPHVVDHPRNGIRRFPDISLFILIVAQDIHQRPKFADIIIPTDPMLQQIVKRMVLYLKLMI
jgi:hypothetical protein